VVSTCMLKERRHRHSRLVPPAAQYGASSDAIKAIKAIKAIEA